MNLYKKTVAAVLLAAVIIHAYAFDFRFYAGVKGESNRFPDDAEDQQRGYGLFRRRRYARFTGVCYHRRSGCNLYF